MFRIKQKLYIGGGGYCPESQIKKLDNGKIQRVKVRKNYVLPDPDNYTLEKMIAAGVPLESVNTKVIHSGVLGSQLMDALEDETNEAFIEQKQEAKKEA